MEAAFSAGKPEVALTVQKLGMTVKIDFGKMEQYEDTSDRRLPVRRQDGFSYGCNTLDYANVLFEAYRATMTAPKAGVLCPAHCHESIS